MTDRAPLYYRADRKIVADDGVELGRLVLMLPAHNPDACSVAIVRYLDLLRELLVRGTFGPDEALASLTRVMRGQAVAGGVARGMAAACGGMAVAK